MARKNLGILDNWSRDIIRQAVNLVVRTEPCFGDIDTDAQGQRHHREFVCGSPSNCIEGNLTIHEPPTPSAGMVNPPVASITAENFSCTPARENRRMVFRDNRLGALPPPIAGGRDSPSAEVMVTAPGKSRPRAHSRKNSRRAFTLRPYSPDTPVERLREAGSRRTPAPGCALAEYR